MRSILRTCIASHLAFGIASSPTQCSVIPGGPLDGPCERGREFCGPAFGASSPQFHIQDLTCGENDPNFPFFDPRHNLYHHFWQSHLASPPGKGPVIGHAVSADLVGVNVTYLLLRVRPRRAQALPPRRDFGRGRRHHPLHRCLRSPDPSRQQVHWAHLPISVWNDSPYDNVAIYTGSATIVNGVPTMVYPGLCSIQDWPACGTGTLLAIALPADHAGDPLLTKCVRRYLLSTCSSRSCSLFDGCSCAAVQYGGRHIIY